ncbi:diguanylate cyclase domain-containing protein [Shewanella sp. NIFS-20-20]|uniref:sensor domain-containing diguanylate cyclase n=1 Tax=Shewanella sp. NIFS-20-20 TaxID=2853806 RepID=UPI001C46D821|nr:diguanylate cyclase [Shewanella sp. NIFS-20-20]MBV7317159.1 diguanylate cyclase [Shewanella sp. NIFS-20-20]
MPHQSGLDIQCQHQMTQLQQLADKYLVAQQTRDTLLDVSKIVMSATSPKEFYLALHTKLRQLIAADNFYIAFLNPKTRQMELPFFADEKDSHPTAIYPDQALSDILKKGLTGYVLRTGEAIICDAKKCQELVLQQQIVDLGSPSEYWIGVPIKSNDTVAGVLAVQSYDPQAVYTDNDIELLNFISQHISGMLNRFMHHEALEQAIQQRTYELSQLNQRLTQEVNERRKAEHLQKSLFDIANLANARVEDKEFYPKLHQILSHLLPANNCYIALLDEDDFSISFPFYLSQRHLSSPKVRKISDGLSEYAMMQRRPLLLSQHQIVELLEQKQIYALDPDLNHTQDVHQWIGIPLFIQGKVKGALTIYSLAGAHNYQASDVELLTFVSQHIATAIERKQHYELLEQKVVQRTKALSEINQDLQNEVSRRQKIEQNLTHQVQHDHLTGLPNRHLFMAKLDAAIHESHQQDNQNFALLFIDLDRFKLINDTLGHLEGDRFLIETAARLTSCIRGQDILGRLGGDEFVILLQHLKHKQDAIDVCDRIIEALTKPFILGNRQFRSGASIGVALNESKPNETSESLLKNADTAMYQAKSQGKGCYVIYRHQAHYHHNHIEHHLSQELKYALQHDKLNITYLPIYDLTTQHCVAFEAKLIWRHAALGKIKQDQLNNLAAHGDFRCALDYYLLEKLKSEYSRLERDYPLCQLHVHLSSLHLAKNTAITELVAVLHSICDAKSALTLLFEEKCLTHDSSASKLGFETLDLCQVKLGIYAYGISYSALSNISFMPISAIKLDPSIAQHLDHHHHLKLAKACVLAAEALELTCFGAGLTEPWQQLSYQALGLRFAQGQLLGDVVELPPQKSKHNTITS